MLLINRNLGRIKKVSSLKEKYNNSTYYFLNSLFHSYIKAGKKVKTFKLFFKIFLLLKKNYRINNLLLFFDIIRLRLHSKIFLRTQHMGRHKYLIPLISVRKSIFLSVRWIIVGIRRRRERTLILRLYSEFCDILNYKRSSRALLEKRRYYKRIKEGWANFRFLRFLQTYTKPRQKFKSDSYITSRSLNKFSVIKYKKYIKKKKKLINKFKLNHKRKRNYKKKINVNFFKKK